MEVTKKKKTKKARAVVGVDKPETFPSQEFSEATGIKGVFTEWIMPLGMTHDEVGKICEKWCESPNNSPEEEKACLDLANVYKKLIVLNPELSTISVSTFHSLHCLVLGAVSKFTLKDINFFITTQDKSRCALIEYNLANRARTEKIEEVCGEYPQWVMHPDTRDMVEKALGITK